MRRTDAKVRKAGSECLPAKFTDQERRAYDWLHDCGIRPWLVDLATKKVTTPQGKFDSLVAYATHKGWKQ